MRMVVIVDGMKDQRLCSNVPSSSDQQARFSEVFDDTCGHSNVERVKLQ